MKLEATEKQNQWELEKRRIATDPSNFGCPCPSKVCEWKGKCKECVAIHRIKKNHLPMCLQFFIKEKVVSE